MSRSSSEPRLANRLRVARAERDLSQGELAQYVGTTRETVNKQIRAWSEQGVVSMAAGAITIHARDELERLAGLAVA